MNDDNSHWADKLYQIMRKPYFPKGDLAELRRGQSRHSAGQASPALWKTLVHYVPEDQWSQDGQQVGHNRVRQMQVICGLLAELAHRVPPGSGLRLGRAMAQADVSEARVMRLLKAHGEELYDSLRGVVHLLASQGIPVRPSDLARLVLWDGTRFEEQPRNSIARDYYSKAKRTASQGS
ncbi:MAG TPA: type I-E CRISPR-associated protein Cse2/CasB [Acidobacteriota bacterium]|nr:type I-E CRISPR-associated protein Cse2/CasB [Acidobacteriota bacterium]